MTHETNSVDTNGPNTLISSLQPADLAPFDAQLVATLRETSNS